MKQKGYMHGGRAYSLFICCKAAVHIDSAVSVGCWCSEVHVRPLDCRGGVASVRDSYTDDPSSIPVRLVVASW